MAAPVELYSPVEGAESGVVRHRLVAVIGRGGRGDIDEEGVYTPSGTITLEVDSFHNVQRGWYAVVGGQQFQVSGVEPIPPAFNRTLLTLATNQDALRLYVYLTDAAGNRVVDEDGNRLVGTDPSAPTRARLGT